MNRDPVESWALAQSIAHDAAQLRAVRADGLQYANLRVTVDGRSVDGDEAHDLMRLRMMTGRHDEAECIGRAITEALVAEIDRRGVPSAPDSVHSFDYWIERDGEDVQIVVHVLSWIPGRAARTYGPPERCWPEEPAEIEWTVSFPDGRSAEHLLTPEEAERIEAEAAMTMAELDDAERDAYLYEERETE